MTQPCIHCQQTASHLPNCLTKLAADRRRRDRRRAQRHPYRNNIGSISSGTMRPEDLIPAFIAEFDSQVWRNRQDINLVSEIRRASVKRGYYDDPDVEDDLTVLFDILGNYCLPYFYFGAHPGDGADYGYWLTDDFQDEFDGLKVDDTSQVPADYTGEVLHVSDHGNMTLYTARKGKLTEVWGIV